MIHGETGSGDQFDDWEQQELERLGGRRRSAQGLARRLGLCCWRPKLRRTKRFVLRWTLMRNGKGPRLPLDRYRTTRHAIWSAEGATDLDGVNLCLNSANKVHGPPMRKYTLHKLVQRSGAPVVP
jgi:hypothetical protein